MPHPKQIYCLACKEMVDNHLVGDISQHSDAVYDCFCGAANVVPKKCNDIWYFALVVDLVLTKKALQQIAKEPPHIETSDKD